MHVMARETWTDERLDELAKRMDEGFGEVKGEIHQLREESTSLRKEMGEVREGLGEVNAKIDGLTRTMQIGFWLMGSFLVGLMGMFAAQL